MCHPSPRTIGLHFIAVSSGYSSNVVRWNGKKPQVKLIYPWVGVKLSNGTSCNDVGPTFRNLEWKIQEGGLYNLNYLQLIACTRECNAIPKTVPMFSWSGSTVELVWKLVDISLYKYLTQAIYDHSRLPYSYAVFSYLNPSAIYYTNSSYTLTVFAFNFTF